MGGLWRWGSGIAGLGCGLGGWMEVSAMLRGRPAKRAEVKKAEGNRGHRKIVEAPVGRAGAPEAPGYLDEGALAVWERVTPLLEKMGLDHLDRDVLAIYCQAVADVERLTGRVRDDEVAHTDNGFPVQNALVSVLEKARDRVVKLAAEFGMSPAARLRFASKASEAQDPLSAWIREQENGGGGN